jgi:uncharacterized protein YjbI with pentapeptide repeats
MQASTADLAGARLDGSRMAGVRLSYASLPRASLRGVAGSDAAFTKADLTGAVLDGASLPGGDFRGAKLVEASFRGAHPVTARLDPAGSGYIPCGPLGSPLPVNAAQEANMHSLAVIGPDKRRLLFHSHEPDAGSTFVS